MDTKIGNVYEVINVSHKNEDIEYRIYELGFTPKTIIKVLQKTPFGVSVEKINVVYAIDAKTASLLEVKDA